MTTFLALYRGETVCGAQLVAVSADKKLVNDFAARLVADDGADPSQEADEKPHAGREGLRLVTE